MLIITNLSGQTKPVSDYSFEKYEEVNGEFSLTADILNSEKNEHSFELVTEESILEYEGHEYRIKQITANRMRKSVTAHHVFFDLVGTRKYDIYGGTKTIEDFLGWTLQDTGWTFDVANSFSQQLIPNYGENNVLALIWQLCGVFECEVEIMPNRHIRIHKERGEDNDVQFRYGHNTKSLRQSINTNDLRTVIKGYGGNGLEVTYRSNMADVFGEIHAEPIHDDNFVVSEDLLEHIKRQLKDTPDVSIEVEAVGTLTDVNVGDKVWLIYEPLGIELQTRIMAKKSFSNPFKTPIVILGNVKTTSSDILVQTNVKIDENAKQTRSKIEQTASSINLNVTKIETKVNEMGKVNLSFWARHYRNSPLYVRNINHPIYGDLGYTPTHMTQVLGGMFNNANPATNMILGGIDSPATAWSLINNVKLYKMYETQDYLDDVIRTANYFVNNAIDCNYYGAPFKAFPNSLQYNAELGWLPSTNFIHMRTFYHVAWALLEAYSVTQNTPYKTLAQQLLDGASIFTLNINSRVNSGEIVPYMWGGIYNTIHSSDGVSFTPSWNTFSTTTLDVMWKAITKYIDLFGDEVRTNGANEQYTVSSIRNDYATHLKDLYDFYELRRPNGHNLLYCFLHHEWSDLPDALGRYVPIPQNWDFINDIWGKDQWFTGDLEFWAIKGFALAGYTDIATSLLNQYYSLRVTGRGEEIVFYDRYDKDGLPLPDDQSISIVFTALFMSVNDLLANEGLHQRCVETIKRYQIISSVQMLDGGIPWDIIYSNSFLESKSLGEIIYAPIEKVSIRFNVDNVLSETSEIVSSLESRVTISEGEIDLRVREVDFNGDEMASRINLSSTTIQIEASKINLVGAVTFSMLSSEVATEIDSKAAYTDLGSLAYQDMVEEAMLGTTIIQGGYIRSDLLTADNIVTGTLSADRIATNLAQVDQKLHLGGIYATGGAEKGIFFTDGSRIVKTSGVEGIQISTMQLNLEGSGTVFLPSSTYIGTTTSDYYKVAKKGDIPDVPSSTNNAGSHSHGGYTGSEGAKNGGIPIGTKIALYDGGYATWSGIPSHSHSISSDGSHSHSI